MSAKCKECGGLIFPDDGPCVGAETPAGSGLWTCDECQQINVIVYDIETKTVADDHPGRWNDIPKFGMSLAVTWDNVTHTFRTFTDAGRLYENLLRFDRVVSFNGLRFDNPIVAHDAEKDVGPLDDRTFDVLVDLTRILGHRVKMDQVAEGTLNRTKVAVGTQAVEWWKAAEELRKVTVDDNSSALSRALKMGTKCLMKRLEYYCRMDVEILHDIYLHGCQHGKVLYSSYGQSRTVSVDWPDDWYKEKK